MPREYRNKAAEAIMEHGPIPSSELPYDTVTPDARRRHDLAKFRMTKVSRETMWYVMGEHDEEDVVRACLEHYPALWDMNAKQATLAFRAAGSSWHAAWKRVKAHLKQRSYTECPRCGVGDHLRCDCELPF